LIERVSTLELFFDLREASKMGERPVKRAMADIAEALRRGNGVLSIAEMSG
jgi:hypothetical protein